MGQLTTGQTLAEIRVFSVIIDTLQDLYTETASGEPDEGRVHELIDSLYRPMLELREQKAGGPYFTMTLRRPNENIGLLINCSMILIDDLEQWDKADLFNKFRKQARDMLDNDEPPAADTDTETDE